MVGRLPSGTVTPWKRLGGCVVKTWAQTEQDLRQRKPDGLRANLHPNASFWGRGAVLVAQTWVAQTWVAQTWVAQTWVTKTWGAKPWGIGLGLVWGLGLMTWPALGQTQAPKYLTDSEANPSGDMSAQDTFAQDTLPPLPQRGLFRPITLSPGFNPDPLLVGGISGGWQAAEVQAGRGETETGICWGYVSEQPDHRLVLTEFFDYLTVGVTSAGDTTLVISGPGGTWCSDDAQGHNPRIGGQWLPGTYQVWVGSADADAYFVYDLQLTEVE